MRDSSPEDHATPHGVGLYILSTLLGASDNWKGYNTEVHGARSWMGGAHWDAEGLGWVAPIGMEGLGWVNLSNKCI